MEARAATSGRPTIVPSSSTCSGDELETEREAGPGHARALLPAPPEIRSEGAGDAGHHAGAVAHGAHAVGGGGAGISGGASDAHAGEGVGDTMKAGDALGAVAAPLAELALRADGHPRRAVGGAAALPVLA